MGKRLQRRPDGGSATHLSKKKKEGEKKKEGDGGEKQVAEHGVAARSRPRGKRNPCNSRIPWKRVRKTGMGKTPKEWHAVEHRTRAEKNRT